MKINFNIFKKMSLILIINASTTIHHNYSHSNENIDITNLEKYLKLHMDESYHKDIQSSISKNTKILDLYVNVIREIKGSNISSDDFEFYMNDVIVFFNGPEIGTYELISLWGDQIFSKVTMDGLEREAISQSLINEINLKISQIELEKQDSEIIRLKRINAKRERDIKNLIERINEADNRIEKEKKELKV